MKSVTSLDQVKMKLRGRSKISPKLTSPHVSRVQPINEPMKGQKMGQFEFKTNEIRSDLAQK